MLLCVRSFAGDLLYIIARYPLLTWLNMLCAITYLLHSIIIIKEMLIRLAGNPELGHTICFVPLPTG